MLSSLQRELTARILDLPDVEIRKSRFGNAEAFYIGKREFAHFHSSEEIDVRLTRFWIKKLSLATREDPRVNIPRSGGDWIEVRFKRESDLVHAMELIETAFKANRV